MKHFAFATATTIAIGLTTIALAANWDMPTPYGDTTFHTQNIMQFAEDVAQATDGKVNITIHSAGSLFPHSEIKNAIRSRQVPIGEFFLSRLVNEDKAFGLDSQPFLATSYEDAARLWESQKPIIAKLLNEQGLIPLFSVPWPAQGLYTNGEITKVKDLSGLRFRAYNAALEEFATLAGAAPVQVEVPDIPQAFATGQVEAMITSPSTGANSTAWDFVTHYSPIDAWIPKNIVVMNQRAFRKLNKNERQAILDSATAAEKRGWEMSKAEAQAKTAILKKNGMVVYEPSAELKVGLQKIGEQMLANLRQNSSNSMREILKLYQK